MKSALAGYALVLYNYANPTDEKSWSHLYTTTIEVLETSCLGFYTKLTGQSTFQVRLVWAESRSIYKMVSMREGSYAELNKVNIKS